MMFDLVPWWYVLGVAFGFGVIIGSFLNVVIYRFHTGKSIAGSSHCLSCQNDLGVFELVPLLSYLGLCGRCRHCGAHIPSRYFWVELATGLLFMMIVATVPMWWLWPVYAVLVAVLVVTAVYDIYHLVIPHVFVGILSVLALIQVGYEWYLLPDVWFFLYRLLSTLLAFLFFAGLWWWSDGRWIGLGDAKLVVPLAFMLTPLAVFSLVVWSFWIGTIISLSIIGWQRFVQRGQTRLRFLQEPLTMKSEVPFAPFLIVAFVVVFFFHIDVLDLIAYVIPYS
jgi:leader peptidase (prepilin peptidase) / N-methyltransferase